MENRPNLYQNSAFLYDLDPRDIVQADIPFYLEYAKNYPGPILELACGTGRVALALARQGHFVHGLDLSKSMLKQFQKKLGGKPREVRKRVKFELAAMADFSLRQKFSPIIIPFRSFQSLTDGWERVNFYLHKKISHF